MTLTVNQALDAYEAARRLTVAEPGNIKYITRAARRILGDVLARDVTQAVIDQFVSRRQAEGAGLQTARRDLTAVMSALRMANRRGEIPAPRYIVLPPRGTARQRFLTPDETQRLIQSAADPRLRLYIQLGLATAARRGALCDLTWDRVDLDRGIIDFRAPHPRAAQRKGRAVVPISAKIIAVLADHRAATQGDLVIGLRGPAVQYHFKRAVARAGLGPEVTPHVLRHTAASFMVKSVPLIIASRMLGHSNTKITESVYVHVTADDLRPAADALDGIIQA
ncbi:site-specific integrase [Paracoccus sp. (in: a-proteobacteria)]|uniref:tyrosine-type recombinase/integrase n=1 Tax=Paracoccus sp. TaxID=267 RepID=UPI0026DFC765|nr:site-specific integrase [Paracoccus sp. (in: a-proteobacteria)]MDO5648834.1 site-specific integrase [Paracoccus sp. (in: a-proteobacteria)]